MNPMSTHISGWISVVFILYTAFVFFAMMNVVTSYFVENTIRAVDESRGSNMGEALWNAFTNSYPGDSLNCITADMFYRHINTPEMIRYLRSLDMVPETCEENNFFELLDADGSGVVDMDELIHGCLRLR